MDQLLINAFKIQIQTKEGFDFEDFINELYLLKYGIDNFMPLRRTGDEGNDGTIISEKKILACYAPKKYNKIEFQDKVLGSKKNEGDFEKYIKNWKEKYPNWEMLVNHEISPDQIKIIDDLDGNTSIKGIKQILHIIEYQLSNSKVRLIAKYLGIDEYVKQDYLREILGDLLNPLTKDERIKYKIAPYIPDKIQINYKLEDVDGALSEFYEISQNFTTIQQILFGYDEDEQGKIKWRIIEDYNKLNGEFKLRLENQIKQYVNQYGDIEDDDYRFYVKSILLYMFEQCLIGKKTKAEL